MVMGLVVDKDFVITDDEKIGLQLAEKGGVEIFVSNAAMQAETFDRCILYCTKVKAANPDALFITYSSAMPDEKAQAVIDGWMVRSLSRSNHLRLQVFLWDYLHKKPKAELLEMVRLDNM